MSDSVWVAVIGVGGVFLGAVVAGLAALATGWQSRRWARTAWLLDSRRSAYLALMAATQTFASGVGQKFAGKEGPWIPADDELVDPALTSAILQAALVASDPVHVTLDELQRGELRDYQQRPTKATAEALEDKLVTLQELMRADLVSRRGTR